MLGIRFHGRGGQGIKTASRILGSAFFLAGYETQDAPRYGAERRGAPMFAYVRADKTAIYERGIITRPDLIVVADETLLPLPAAGVSAGITSQALLLIHSSHSLEELLLTHGFPCPAILLPPLPSADSLNQNYLPAGSSCAAGAAQLLGLSWQTVQQALEMELSNLDEQLLTENIRTARTSYEQVAESGYRVTEQAAPDPFTTAPPHWIELPFEDATISAPTIHGTATSLHMDTGSWRILRPIINQENCSRCGLCHTYCPDGVISFDRDGFPVIDYCHCKGCMICVVQCPLHAIETFSEQALPSSNQKEKEQCANS